MHADATDFARTLDRTVTREIRYRQAMRAVASVRARARFEIAEAANDALLNDASLPRAVRARVVQRALDDHRRDAETLAAALRFNCVALAAIAALLGLAVLFA
jgi:hypothetical protein